ncbi:MAG: hypothetical protein OXF09_00115 [Hyphomicrobiales bacterium]|nr:hypothetical protein [Hyphomicrobiales bacterium]
MSSCDSFIAPESRLYRRVLVADCNEFFLLRAVKGSRHGCRGGRGDRSRVRVLLKTRLRFSKKYFRYSRAQARKNVRRGAPRGAPWSVAPAQGAAS